RWRAVTPMLQTRTAPKKPTFFAPAPSPAPAPVGVSQTSVSFARVHPRGSAARPP
ncbi:hypothetical protein P7K49_008407, partial [Saguinus oedipus]